MAGAIDSLHHHHRRRHSLTLDPASLILSQFSGDQPQLLQLEPQSFYMERGPRYDAYAALRESSLRMKRMKQSIPEDYEEEEDGLTLTPPKKQVKFQAPPPSRRAKGCSILAQSVPDFSSALRKENRKPPPPPPSSLPTLMEKSLTPPPPVKSRMAMGKLSGSGSKSVNSGDKRGAAGGMMTRKSYASLEGLRGLASDARSSIIAENRGSSRNGRGIGKTVLGYSRQY